MSSHRLVLIVLVIAGSAIGCRRERDLSVTRAKAMEPGVSTSTSVACDAPGASAETATPGVPAETYAPAATVERRPDAETNEAPAVTPSPAPQPPSRPSPPSPQVVVVPQPPAPPPPATVVIVQPPAAPSGPHAAPIVASPYAPTAAAQINDAGIMIPAVPLNIDPGAPPGAPGNGAPNTSTTGGG